jgi:mannose-6-phosphate isomerase-like protein (cupin superfamily)
MLRATAALIGCLLVCPYASAQSAPRPVRVVIASERLAEVGDAPRYFRVFRVELAKGQAAAFSGASGYVFVVSGKLAMSIGGSARSLAKGEAAFVKAGDTVSLQGPAQVIHFLLESGAPGTKPPYSGTAKATELYRTKDPIPGLESGPYEFSLTKVTSPPKVKPPMHHRSGAAIYFVLQGGGTLYMESGAEPRKAGAVQYEPNSFVHTWENSGSVPLVLLQANLSREGTPEIIFLR